MSGSSNATCEGTRLSKNTSVIIGWTTLVVGTAFWAYGYLATGNPSLIDWHIYTPWWIADFLPNIESEIGMALVCVGMIPIYLPPRQ
jgi:hypothetical protein